MSSLDKDRLNKDRRIISGTRLYSHCEIEIPDIDPFAPYKSSMKSGNLVLNTRGGCLYLSEQITNKTIDKLFQRDKTTTFKVVKLYTPDHREIEINNIRAKFLRVRREMTREGIVFRFINFSDAHFEILNNLNKVLPQFDPQMDFPEFIPVQKSQLTH